MYLPIPLLEFQLKPIVVKSFAILEQFVRWKCYQTYFHLWICCKVSVAARSERIVELYLARKSEALVALMDTVTT